MTIPLRPAAGTPAPHPHLTTPGSRLSGAVKDVAGKVTHTARKALAKLRVGKPSPQENVHLLKSTERQLVTTALVNNFAGRHPPTNSPIPISLKQFAQLHSDAMIKNSELE